MNFWVIRRWVCCVNLIGFGNLFFVSDGLEFVLAVCTMFSSLHLPFFLAFFWLVMTYFALFQLICFLF